MVEIGNKPEVTVIIATYNRPQVLAKAIKSVQNQTFKDWVLYVIGDNCSESTKELMAGIKDDRIFYYNNPFRFGDQSGGNNIGIALAETDYVALLNHDDLWAPDHLEVAISSLKKNNKDFYIGRAILSHMSENSIPVLKMVNPINRDPSWAFLGKYMLFEPCSTWVIKTGKAKTGYWKQKIDIFYRTPPQEYIIKAWKRGVRFIFGERITCVYLSHHNNPELRDKSQQTSYEYAGKEHDYVLGLFANNNQGFKEVIKNGQLKPQKFEKICWVADNPVTLKQKIRFFIFHSFFNKFTAYLYRLTGVDMLYLIGNIQMRSKEKRIQNKINALQKKTGENSIQKQDIKKVILYARQNFKPHEYFKLDQ
jgi:glycosyltransferase involved in cell wall biosynthesis